MDSLKAALKAWGDAERRLSLAAEAVARDEKEHLAAWQAYMAASLAVVEARAKEARVEGKPHRAGCPTLWSAGC